MAASTLRLLCTVVASALLTNPLLASELVLTQGTNFAVDVSRQDGRIAIDLLGHIWILSARGGEAQAVGDNTGVASNPKWSPDGKSILYEVTEPGISQIWLLDSLTGVSRAIGEPLYFDRQPSWHPDGSRIVFSSPRGQTGFDIWEQDIATGVATQISSDAGNDSEPAWSSNGFALAYIRQENGIWSLIVRRDNEEQRIIRSADRLSAPSWRPDGTLLMYQRHATEGATLEMAILSEPPIVRAYSGGEDLFAAAISWKDRTQFFYAADGIIKKRNFDARHSQRISFRAYVNDLSTTGKKQRLQRSLKVIDTPLSRLVMRASRLFTGGDSVYLIDHDVLIENGRIADIVSRQEWPAETILDLGDVTIMPGLIDAFSALPKGPPEIVGPLLLSLGITTLVTADVIPVDEKYAAWHGESSPGPRVLKSILASEPVPAKLPDDLAMVQVASLVTLSPQQRLNVDKWRETGLPLLVKNWQAGLGLDADLALGIQSMPASPGGKRYQDLQLGNGHAAVTLVSGMAGANTVGVQPLLTSRQGELLRTGVVNQAYADTALSFGTEQTALVLGSQPNGLPAGLALHAELRAMQYAGLSPAAALQSAGVNPAKALGYEKDLGQIRPGGLADLVIVDGDPLNNVDDAFKVIGVVRNGRFFSVGGLLDRAMAMAPID